MHARIGILYMHMFMRYDLGSMGLKSDRIATGSFTYIGGQILRTSFGKKISRAREDVLSINLEHLENYILRTLNKHILRTFQG